MSRDNGEPCPVCPSSDAYKPDKNGWWHCFSCGHNGKEEGDAVEQKVDRPASAVLLPVSEFPSWKSRGLSAESCRKWRLGVSQLGSNSVRVFQYGRDAQKLRDAEKNMAVRGPISEAGLYGQDLWGTGGKMVVVTEGEIDAVSISQVQGHKWPVVSLPTGASGAKRAIQKNLEWLQTYETVVLWFDDDDAGREAAEACAPLFRPGQCKIASCPPYKDANEALLAGGKIVEAIWQAKVWRPDGIVGTDDIYKAITANTYVESVPYPWEGLQSKTEGLRASEVVTLTAGSGVGKSAVVRSLAHHLLKQGETVGLMMFEETVKRAALGIMSIELKEDIKNAKDVGQIEDFDRAFRATVGSGRCYLYDHFGSTGFDNVLDRARYMASALDCRWLFLDHLSILVSGMADGDERRLIDNAMTSIKTLAMETNMGIILVSHLRRPDGKGHEEGASTSLSQLRGSHAIAQLSDIVIGLERNQQDPLERDTTTMRVLKNRWSGQTGIACRLQYDHFTTTLQEIPYEEAETPGSRGSSRASRPKEYSNPDLF